ncbi:MAG: MBL fold metallo-hydrolase [Armatimonadota bacterium]|nr:MBL fold metallo-hydrolase [Armatimonadota bacterium]MDR7486460.1 MBL fold metallo-hydrolase [Armatimonadota bacterium]MDR7537199.1 MBL fold metallo-hydrolase [Armatimonadota bacterium]
MRVLLATALCLGLLVAPVGSVPSSLAIRWYGQSFFLVTTADGLRIAIDPFEDIGFPLPTVEADVVLITHEHRDHNNAGLIRGRPRVLRGLAPGAADWNRIYERVGSTLIYAVPGFHDDVQGASRGLDAFFVIETDGVRLAHLGDVGQPTLSEHQLRALGRIDVLMIPVGAGPFTVSVADANRLVDQIRPRVIIPMHYKTAARPTWPGLDERPFLEGKPNVRRLGRHTLILAREQVPATPQVVVMEWQ